MSLKVHQLQYLSLSSPRTHKALFIETHPPTSQTPKPRGTSYDVTGSILMGMKYRFQTNYCPNDDPSLLSKALLGHIAEADIEKVDEVCRGIKPPGKQVDLQGRRLDQSVALYRCTEWFQDVVGKLGARGILMVEVRKETPHPIAD